MRISRKIKDLPGQTHMSPNLGNLGGHFYPDRLTKEMLEHSHIALWSIRHQCHASKHRAQLYLVSGLIGLMYHALISIQLNRKW